MKKDFKISLQEAAWYVYSFLRNPELGRLAKEEALGGTITKAGLLRALPLKFKGAMGWFCRNMKKDPRFPPLFIAFEKGEYDIGQVPPVPKTDPLIYPIETFTFSSDLSEENVRNMIFNDQRSFTDPDGEIYQVDLLDFINRLPIDPMGQPYNRYACSFFETEIDSDLRNFLSTPGLAAVRYYFGYNDSDIYHNLSNRIRVIFIGVDAQGKNIPPAGAIDVPTFSMLQNSWPPPPPY